MIRTISDRPTESQKKNVSETPKIQAQILWPTLYLLEGRMEL